MPQVIKLFPMERSAGDIIRYWRKKRQLSQMALADKLDISFRHMNYVENDKTKGSRDLLLRVGNELDLTYRARNALLAASGHSPQYRELDLSTDEAAEARRILEFALKAAEPYPANIIDVHLNIVMRNRAMDFVIEYFAGDPEQLLSKPLTMPRLNFHSSGLIGSMVNPEETLRMYLGRVHRYLEASDYDYESMQMVNELEALGSNILNEDSTGLETESEKPHLLIPLKFKTGPYSLSVVTAVATLGWTQDVTLEELRIEYAFPADDASNDFLQQAQANGWSLPLPR